MYHDLGEAHHAPGDGTAAPWYVVVGAGNKELDSENDGLAAKYVALGAGHFGMDLEYFKDALREESNDLWNGSKPYKD